MDGKSIVSLLGTSPPTVSNWRKGILTENWRTEAVGGTSGAPTYKALRTQNFSWVGYVNGERGLYDLRNDPYQLHSRAPSKNRSLVRGLNNRLDGLATCDGPRVAPPRRTSQTSKASPCTRTRVTGAVRGPKMSCYYR